MRSRNRMIAKTSMIVSQTGRQNGRKKYGHPIILKNLVDASRYLWLFLKAIFLGPSTLSIGTPKAATSAQRFFSRSKCTHLSRHWFYSVYRRTTDGLRTAALRIWCSVVNRRQFLFIMLSAGQIHRCPAEMIHVVDLLLEKRWRKAGATSKTLHQLSANVFPVTGLPAVFHDLLHISCTLRRQQFGYARMRMSLLPVKNGRNHGSERKNRYHPTCSSGIIGNKVWRCLTRSGFMSQDCLARGRAGRVYMAEPACLLQNWSMIFK